MAERWEASNNAVRTNLERGPNTVQKIVQETGYSESVVRKAVQREGIRVVPNTWPREYALIIDEAEPEPEQPRTVQYVKPLEFDRAEVGMRWQEGKLKFAKDIQGIDLYKVGLDVARERLRAATAAMLGVLIHLDELEDGPEWRMEVGL